MNAAANFRRAVAAGLHSVAGQSFDTKDRNLLLYYSGLGQGQARQQLEQFYRFSVCRVRQA